MKRAVDTFDTNAKFSVCMSNVIFEENIQTEKLTWKCIRELTPARSHFNAIDAPKASQN